MGSFAAVNNFRANLGSGWRHTSYKFTANVDFRYHIVTKMVSRLGKRYTPIRLGIYLSHSIFSDFQDSQVTSFFFDSFLDRRYNRYWQLFSGPRRSRQRKIWGRSRFRTKNYEWVAPVSSLLHRSGSTYSEPFQRLCRSDFCHSRSLGSFSYFATRLNGASTLQMFSYIPHFSSRIWMRIFRLGVLFGLRFFFHFSSSRKRVKSNPIFVPTSLFRLKTHSKLFSVAFWLSKLISKPFRIRRFRSLLSYSLPFTRFGKYAKFGFISLASFDQLRIMFHSVYKFFFSYYFRYYPYRLEKLFRTSGFLFVRKMKALFACSGWKLRWIYFGKRSFSRWLFNQVYSKFFRKNFFFCLTQNTKMINFFFGMGVSSQSFLINLSGFGILPSALMSTVFVRRLKRRERVNPILYSLVRLALTRKKIVGLVILRNGRFTKRQRAVHTIHRLGRVSYNSHLMPIDYSFSTAILKYSIVSIKVWVSAAPAFGFYKSESIADNGGLIYPSNLVGYFSRKYWYVWKVSNFFRYLFPVETETITSRSSHSLVFRSKFTFRGSWNYGYMRAYRRFTKSFAFTRYNYVRRLYSRRHD